MGKRIHVLTKRVVKYSNHESFNWKYNEFQMLLERLGCNTYPDSTEFPDNFEVEVDKFENALNILKANKDRLYKENYDVESEDIEMDAIPSRNICVGIDVCFDKNMADEDKVQHIIDEMETFLKAADKHDGYIYFSAF